MNEQMRRILYIPRAIINIASIASLFWVAFSYQKHLESVAARKSWESHTLRMVGIGRAMVNDLGEVRGAIRDHRESGNPADLDRSRAARIRFEVDFHDAKESTIDNPQQGVRLARVRRAADAVFRRLDAGDPAALAEFPESRAAIGAFIDAENALLESRSRAAKATFADAVAATRLALVPLAFLAIDAAIRVVGLIAHRGRRGFSL